MWMAIEDAYVDSWHTHTLYRPLILTKNDLKFLIVILSQLTLADRLQRLTLSFCSESPEKRKKKKKKMTLNLSLCSPNFISSSSTPRFGKIHETSSNPNNNTSALLSFLLAAKKATRLRGFRIEASLSESENGVVEEELLSRVSGAKDASEVLEIVAESSKRSGGVLTVDECCLIINAAIDRGNTDLALSIFYAMRSSFDQGTDT